MSLTTKVAVIGATGGLGREAVQQLAERGIPCKILVRSSPSATPPASISKESSKSDVAAYLASLKGVEVVEGDVSNVESLKTLLDGCTSCLALYGATRRSKLSDLWVAAPDKNDPTHAKNINYQGVANILEAIKATKTCQRVVRITGAGEDPTGMFSVLINMLGSMAKAWNYEGELLLRQQKDVNYTIIRPGVMSRAEDGAEQPSLYLNDDGQDLPVSKISYQAVADLCIESLSYPNAAQTTLVAMTSDVMGKPDPDRPKGEATFAPLLAKVQADRRTFPTDMLQQHQAAVRKAVLTLGAVATVLVAIVVQFLVRAIMR